LRKQVTNSRLGFKFPKNYDGRITKMKFEIEKLKWCFSFENEICESRESRISALDIFDISFYIIKPNVQAVTMVSKKQEKDKHLKKLLE